MPVTEGGLFNARLMGRLWKKWTHLPVGKSIVNTDCQQETNFASNVKSFIITTKLICH